MNRSELPIASPCGADWRGMTPRDVATRLCATCDKHVHDLSRMTRPEAQRVLASQATKDLCVRYLFDERGEILFAPEAPKLVPASRLAVVKRLVAAAALASAPLSVAACMGEPMPPPVMVQGGVVPIPAPAPTTSPGTAPSEIPAPSTSSVPCTGPAPSAVQPLPSSTAHGVTPAAKP